ncbi:uncharacterized protein FOMMEDRAFT_150757 [Fomitiporia mediterranea MF3/22]|uniref:uncharacterized protein n=1 Tax=Fomitiporia mediterranea (strain MF3/22) TaxID=694068 RepID=UPI000440934E|nr:uncharacterized protein FOMMEDRAFT_150757 [Fomitiporia mediterranea MF3/22]EJD08085.1 hypothetical protein FOMMEDRAFT_150757 [Fomitiporia mediterranea MF3/22]
MANQTLDYGVLHTIHPRSNAIDIDPSLVQTSYSQEINSMYFSVAFLTVLVYNSLVTIDKEEVQR